VIVAPDHFLEARLVDRHAAGFEHVDLGLILVDADDRVAVFGKARSEHEADVPGADDGDFHIRIRY